MKSTLTKVLHHIGGKAMIYAYSLRVWLTGRKAKASFVLDDKGSRIGSEAKVKLEKERSRTAAAEVQARPLTSPLELSTGHEALACLLAAMHMLPGGPFAARSFTATARIASQWLCVG